MYTLRTIAKESVKRKYIMAGNEKTIMPKSQKTATLKIYIKFFFDA